MIDPFVILAPILLLPVVALLQFVGCTFASGTPDPTAIPPTFHPPGGTFSGTQSVTLSAISGQTIHYTTATPPMMPPTPTASNQGSLPIIVSTSTTISAIASAPGFTDSDPATETYLIRPIVEVEVGGVKQRRICRSSSAVGSLTCTYPAPVTAGSLLIAVGGVDTNPGSVIVTDTLPGGTSPMAYKVLLTPSAIPPGGNKYFIAYRLAPSSGPTTITVDPSVDGFLSFAIDEFSGVHPTLLDVGGEATNPGTGTTPSAVLTTVSKNALILGVVGHGTGSNISIAPSPSGNYTQIGEEEDQATFMAFNAVFRIATTPGPYTVDWSLGTSGAWAVYTAAFKPEHS